MEKMPRSRRRGTALLGLGLAVAFCFTPTDNLAPASVTAHIGGDAWAFSSCGGYMSPLDPNCADPDTDGDGMPDSRDPCPQDPFPNCETVVAYGDRSHLPACSDGTRVADVKECPNYYAASGNGNGGSQDDDDSGAGGGGGGGGGSPVARSPVPPATAGASIADDVKFVEACADEGRGVGPPHVFYNASEEGVVNVSYGDAGTGYNGNPAQGRTARNGASVSITMDFEVIKENAPEELRNYWQQFANVLLHEYHHAYDMLLCRCSDPDVRFKLTRQQYENDTQRKADEDFDRLFGRANAACLAD